MLADEPAMVLARPTSQVAGVAGAYFAQNASTAFILRRFSVVT